MRCAPSLIAELSRLGRVIEDAPLRDYTTFKCGGPADVLVYPGDAMAVGAIMVLVRDAGLPLTVIGGGSNLLVGDGGIEGVVLRMSADGVIPAGIRYAAGDLLAADAWMGKEDFINGVIDAGYGGVEFMAGIPGCLGGGIAMNAGTTMGCFVDILAEVDIVDGDGRARTVAVHRGMSAYRHMDLGTDCVITGARFALPRESRPEALREHVKAIIADRWQKHPMNFPSAGSVFKNPPGHASWKLVNDAGLRGHRVGGAMVSDLHTNFIVNAGGATARDIRRCIELVRDEVHRRTGVTLETEVRMIGRF